MKLCKDCKWANQIDKLRPKLWVCESPNNYMGIDLVSGEKLAKYFYCSSHRELELQPAYLTCGESGHWFEPKGEIKS